MSIKIIIIICWWISFLVGCVIAYTKYRKDKKEQDEIICEMLKRHMYISKD